jgi:hypothetical protein
MRPIVLTRTGAGDSAVAPMDIHGKPEISLQVVVSGSVDYTIQQTLDDVFDPAVTPTWFDHSDTDLVAQAVNRQGNYAFVPRGVRLKVNSGSGTATLTIIQAGI